MLSVTVCAQDITLLPSGAAWLREADLLLVADAHFGKAQSFRRLGVPVPSGTTDENLQALSADLARTGAARLVFLGDLLHSARSMSERLRTSLLHWRARHAACAMTLVRGNHDDRAGDPPEALGIEVLDGPLRVGPFALTHHPDPQDDAYVIAGHWHPCVIVSGRARERLRLPCFWWGDEARNAVGVLPAYGAFTGMHPIARRPGDRVFALAGDVVREVT